MSQRIKSAVRIEMVEYGKDIHVTPLFLSVQTTISQRKREESEHEREGHREISKLPAPEAGNRVAGKEEGTREGERETFNIGSGKCPLLKVVIDCMTAIQY